MTIWLGFDISLSIKVMMDCPKGFIDLDPNDDFCYRMDKSVSVQNRGAENHCKTKYGGELTSIRSKAVKDAHVKELVESNLNKVFLRLTLKRGQCSLLQFLKTLK